MNKFKKTTSRLYMYVLFKKSNSRRHLPSHEFEFVNGVPITRRRNVMLLLLLPFETNLTVKSIYWGIKLSTGTL